MFLVKKSLNYAVVLYFLAGFLLERPAFFMPVFMFKLEKSNKKEGHFYEPQKTDVQIADCPSL